MRSKRVILQVAAIGVAIALIVSGCIAAGAAVPEEEPLPSGMAVETTRLVKTEIKNELTYIGQVQPLKTVNIASMLAAEVTSVNFDLGDNVSEGDVLFTVDAKDIQDQIKQLQTALNAQSIGVESARYGLELALEGSLQTRLTELQYESGISQSAAAIRQAEESRRTASQSIRDLQDALEAVQDGLGAASSGLAAFVAAHPNKDTYIYNPAAMPATPTGYNPYNPNLAGEYSQLLASISTSRSQVRTLESQIEQARASQRMASISEHQAENAYDNTSESLETYMDVVDQNMEQAQRQAELAVRSAEAQTATTQLQISIAKDNLSRAVITSPIGGVVSSRNIEVGQMVSQAMMPFTIVQMDPVVVQVNVSETLINSIFSGQDVAVSIQALGGDTIMGTVSAVSPVAAATSTFPVKIELENAKSLIKPGMFAQVTFVESRRENTFVTNKNVVQSDESGYFVYVVRDGAAVKAPVETGLFNGQQIEILSGISEQDEIVVIGQEYLYDGVSVNVVARDGQRASG